MKINRLIVGVLETNCYILEKDGYALIIDPGDESSRIKEAIKDLNLQAILITHSHSDHIGALDSLLEEYNIQVLKYDNLVEKNYHIGPFNFEVIYMKGHSNDLVVFYFKEEKVMFVGDFIFKDSIGRMDLPGGNEIDMYNSLKKLKKYPSDITLYPGHGDKTTLSYELKNNYYLKNI